MESSKADFVLESFDQKLGSQTPPLVGTKSKLIYILKALSQVMRTSLPPLGPILNGSAIWKLIGYQRSKVKEVKEFLSGCHLRLIKTRQTDEIPRHSPFLFKFLIFHSSEASPVAWWLMSKKSARKNWQINLGQLNILRIIVSLINIFDCLQKFYSKCEDYLHLCITVSFFSLSMIWRTEGK